jgi:DNA repair protein RadD
MKIKPRPYQKRAHDALIQQIANGGGSPIADLATGLGKSIIVAMCAKTLLERWPSMRIMMLVHKRELVEQNYEKLKSIWPDAPVGIYSAGLGRRDTNQQIIFGSIASVYRDPYQFGPRHATICDECHLIPNSGEGMYRTYFDAVSEMTHGRFRALGLTATPYRMDSGRLDRGDGRLFEDTVFSYGIGEGTRDGWLAPLTARLGDVEIDARNIARRGGEFVAGDVQRAALEEGLLERTADDLVRRGREAGRRSWLIFCAGVDHARMMQRALLERGIATATITGQTSTGDRDAYIAAFKRGEIQAITNADVLTTGFDAPNVDLLAMLRPTLSTGLYIQIMGRGTRMSADIARSINEAGSAEQRRELIAGSVKPNCLVLDYSGNVRRHGPVDMVEVYEKDGSLREDDDVGRVGPEEIRATQCPECGFLAHVSEIHCPGCGYQLREESHAHDDTPDEDVAVMSDQMPGNDVPVVAWRANIHHRGGDPNATPTLRVTFVAGLQTVSEYWCFEHRGMARHKAVMHWNRHTGGMSTRADANHHAVPRSCVEALRRFERGELMRPTHVRVVREGRFDRISHKTFDDAELQRVQTMHETQERDNILDRILGGQNDD